MDILCPVSAGEIIDKLSILYLKRKYIKDIQKAIDIENEIKSIEPLVISIITKYSLHFQCLMWVNEQIWRENELRTTIEDKEQVKNLIVNIMHNNDARFRLKNRINNLLNSTLKEQKSYKYKKLFLVLDNFDDSLCGLITYWSIYFDQLYVQCPKHLFKDIKLFKLDETFQYSDNFKFTDEYLQENNFQVYHINNSIDVYNQFNIPGNVKSELSFVYEKSKKEIIVYDSVGKLGDFIHGLFLLYYNFKTTGKRALLYIIDKHFEYYERTYSELYDILNSQDYIYDFRKYNENEIDSNFPKISVNIYNSPFLYRTDWLSLVIETHKQSNQSIDIQHFNKWIDIPLHKQLTQYNDTVVIHCRYYNHRTETNFPWENIIKNNKCLFITCNKNEYDEFKYKHLLDVKICNSLDEITTIIASSKFFIGDQSGMLAISCALFKPSLACLYDGDCNHYMGVVNYNKNFFWIHRNSYNTKNIEHFINI